MEPRSRALTPGSRGTEVIERLFAAPLVLMEIGMDWDRIEELKDAGAIA